jgi:hypothetical protein
VSVIPEQVSALERMVGEKAAAAEREKVVAWLRASSRLLRDRGQDEWAKARDVAAHCIERGNHLHAPAQVDRNPKGHDPAEGHGRNDESPVAATSGDAPKGGSHAQ